MFFESYPMLAGPVAVVLHWTLPLDTSVTARRQASIRAGISAFLLGDVPW